MTFERVPIYNVQYLITDSLSVIKSFIGYEPTNSCTARVTSEDECVIVIYIDSLDKRSSVIAHEAFHAAGYILSEVGYIYSIERDEPFAYLIEWFVNSINKVIA